MVCFHADFILTEINSLNKKMDLVYQKAKNKDQVSIAGRIP
jgi:hypothetical protein